MQRTPLYTISTGLIMLAFWTFAGSLGFFLLEGWSLIDSIYMTIITISTVGYGEIAPLSLSGKIFASILIVGGLGTAVYTFTRLGQAVMEGELLDILGKRRIVREVGKLNQHYIVCGFGRVGKMVSEGLQRDNLPLCVVDSNPSLEPLLQSKRLLYLFGDATDEAVLEAAGIERAAVLLALLPSDADNLFLTIAAKEMNPKLRVVARAEDERTERRLVRSGADNVVSPYRMAGQRVLQAAVSPTVVEFTDLVTHHDFLSMGEILIGPQTPILGHSISESAIRGSYGLIIMAIKRKGEEMIFNPEPDERFLEGDILVVFGKESDIMRLKEFCKDPNCAPNRKGRL